VLLIARPWLITTSLKKPIQQNITEKRRTPCAELPLLKFSVVCAQAYLAERRLNPPHFERLRRWIWKSRHATAQTSPDDNADPCASPMHRARFRSAGCTAAFRERSSTPAAARAPWNRHLVGDLHATPTDYTTGNRSVKIVVNAAAKTTPTSRQ